MKTNNETKELISRGNYLDMEIKAKRKNKDVPITSCPDGKVMLFYMWHNNVLESIWAAKHPACSIATKIVRDGTLAYRLITHDPENNYVRHMIIDETDVDSLIIWLYAINGMPFAYKSVVSDPYFITKKALGTYLKEAHSIKKSCAEPLIDAFPPSELWPCTYYGETTFLYPKWAIDESVKKYREAAKLCGMNISAKESVPRVEHIPTNYVLDGIVFSRKFGRKIGLICNSLYVPFTKETVTVELLKEYVTVDDLHMVAGMGFASVQDFIKELEEHGIVLKKSGEFSLSKKNVNPFGIDKEKLLDMTVNEVSREYFSGEAYRTLCNYRFEKNPGSYGETTIREIVDECTIEAIRKTKGTREPGISKLVEELAMAGIIIPEK